MIVGNTKLAAQNVRLAVVCYYRKSSQRQETSIEQQQQAVRKFCAERDWNIVEEYIDSGKSGSKDVAKRVEFHRMLSDAKKGKFSAVAVYDSSRFARLDMIDGAEYKKTLRDAGVHLESVTEGKIDWTTQIGRMHDSMLSEANHDFSQRLAKKVVLGKEFALQQGWWPHGRVPYGYDRQFYDGATPKQIDTRKTKSTRAMGWKAKLVINATEAKIVQWIFERYANEDLSCRTICHRLNRDAVEPPKGSIWHLSAILKIIKNPVYKGEATIGVLPKPKREKFAEASAASVTSVPVIVAAELWQRVNDKHAKRKLESRRVNNGKPSALAGVLLCGHCGHRMAHKNINGHRRYVCVSNSLRPHLGCKQRRVDADTITQAVCAEVVKAIDFETIRCSQAKPPAQRNVDVEAMRARVQKLESDVTRGQANLLNADPEDFAIMREMLRAKRKTLDEAKNTSILAQSPADETGAFAAWAARVKSDLITLVPQIGLTYPGMVDGQFGPVPGTVNAVIREGIITDPDTLRALLHRLNLTVTLWWVPRGPRNFSLERGLLRADFGTVQMGRDGENLCDHIENTTVAKVLTTSVRIERQMAFAPPPEPGRYTPAERQTRYRAAHPDRVVKRNAEWLAKNREANKARCKARRAKKSR